MLKKRNKNYEYNFFEIFYYFLILNQHFSLNFTSLNFKKIFLTLNFIKYFKISSDITFLKLLKKTNNKTSINASVNKLKQNKFNEITPLVRTKSNFGNNKQNLAIFNLFFLFNYSMFNSKFKNHHKFNFFSLINYKNKLTIVNVPIFLNR
jgi:hypothetical protein